MPHTTPSVLDPSTARVRAAFAALRRLAPDYHARVFAQRAGRLDDGTPNPAAAGSIYPDRTAAELIDLVETRTTWRPYAHPDVAAGCTAFAADVPGGQLGLIALDALPDATPVRLLDPKGTGQVEAVVAGVRGAATPLTVVILGAEGDTEIAFTFFPGAPIAPSQVPAAGRAGTTVTAADARALGLALAKVG